MREIKFKAVNKKTGEVIENIAIDTNSEHIGYWIDEENYTWVPMVEFDIYEYTGLKDKNGVQIYEGDIVEYKTESINYGNSFNTAICEVFRNVRGAYRLRGKRIYETELYSNRNYVEIIGNIYENPNLLDGDSNGHEDANGNTICSNCGSKVEGGYCNCSLVGAQNE